MGRAARGLAPELLGNVGAAAAFGSWDDVGGAALQLAVNVAGLVIATAYSMLNQWSEWRGYVEIALFIMGAQAAVLGGKPVAAANPARPAA